MPGQHTLSWQAVCQAAVIGQTGSTMWCAVGHVVQAALHGAQHSVEICTLHSCVLE